MAFKDIIGQELAKRILVSAIKNDKISTGYLFYGPEGVGKTLMAKNYAKALNCEMLKQVQHDNVDYDCCDLCKSCKSIENLTNPDFEIVEPLEEKGKKKKNISIDQIRDDIKVRYSYRSAFLKYRVIIIKRADLLSDEASNAFLKILEEPPSKSIFILTTSKVNDLLPTIRSRCQEIRFRKLKLEEIEEFFIRKQDTEYRKQQSLLPLQLANGSITKAERLFDSDFKELRQMAFKFINSSQLERMRMVKKQGAGSTSGTRLGLEELDLKEFSMCIQEIYRDLLVKKLGAPELIKNKDLEFKVETSQRDIASLLDGIQRCEESFDALERNVNKNLILYKLSKELPSVVENYSKQLK